MHHFTPAQYRKAVVALVGFVVQLVQLGVLDDDASKWVTAVIAGLTLLGVYQVPNDDVDGPIASDA